MLAKRASQFVYGLTLLLFTFFSFSFLFFFFVKYDSLVNFILTEINRKDLLKIVTTGYFPLHKFQLLKTISYFISPISGFAFFIFLKYKTSIYTFLYTSINGVFRHTRNFRSALTNNAKQVNYLLIISLSLILVRSVYFATTFYIQHDEAWNNNFFLQKNIIYSFFVYNNYPLHNLVSWLVLKVLPLNTFVLRLPSIISGLLSCMLVFVFIKKIFESEWIALSTMFLFASLPMSIFYMLYARGVMFEIFFALPIGYLLFQYLQEKVTIKKIIFLSLLNALGVLSMLSHVYFIAFTSLAAMLYLIFQKEKQIQLIILYPLISILLTACALLPMIVGSGLTPALKAGTADANYLALHDLPFHCYAYFNTGLWFGFYLLAVANFILLFIDKSAKNQLFILLNLILIFSPFIIKYVSGAFLPERALAFLIIVPITTFAMIAVKYNAYTKWIVIAIVVVAIALNLATYHHPKLNWSKQKDVEVYQLAEMMKANHLTEIYNESNDFIYFIPGIQYYYLCSGNEIKYSTSIKSSNRFVAQRPSTADCLITNKASESETLIYGRDSIFVYKLK